MTDQLPSWNDTPTKAAITAYIERVTDGPDAVPVEERVAVFDNDGTLWTEKPTPVELVFILHRWAEMAEGAMDVFDDGPVKPIRIWSRIGRRPLIAGGNSNGDVPMLAFAGTSARPALRLLVLHDDAGREVDYVKGAEAALERARAEDWTVISIKRDWATVFA